MNRRSDAERNGKAHLNGKGSYSWLMTNRRRPPKILVKQSSALLPLTILSLALGVAILVALQDSSVKPPSAQPIVSRTEAFRRAVNRAMSAAELTQTAVSREEWRTVANWWQEAIDLMKIVPATSPNYSVAQNRILEYGRNLEYAHSRELANASSPVSSSLWTVGSRRAEVIQIQGNPTNTNRYDSMCKEVLYFNNSTVELSNGVVTHYEDLDKNLKVAPDDTPVAPPSGHLAYWTLGSTKDALFKVQGTPSRVVNYDYSDKELLYYGMNTIDIANGKVVGYSNNDGTLKVYIPPIGATMSQPAWTLNSPREEIFKVQGTPTQVVLDDAACSERLSYGNSTVDLSNGFISGYDNADGNLKVRVK